MTLFPIAAWIGTLNCCRGMSSFSRAVRPLPTLYAASLQRHPLSVSHRRRLTPRGPPIQTPLRSTPLQALHAAGRHRRRLSRARHAQHAQHAPVADRREGLREFTVDLDVEPHEVLRAVLQRLVLHRRVALAAALELVEKVGDDLGEGHLVREGRALRRQELHVHKHPCTARHRCQRRATARCARRARAAPRCGL